MNGIHIQVLAPQNQNHLQYLTSLEKGSHPFIKLKFNVFYTIHI